MSLTASAGKLFHNPMVLKKKVVLFTRVQHKIISNIVSSSLLLPFPFCNVLYCLALSFLSRRLVSSVLPCLVSSRLVSLVSLVLSSLVSSVSSVLSRLVGLVLPRLVSSCQSSLASSCQSCLRSGQSSLFSSRLVLSCQSSLVSSRLVSSCQSSFVSSSKSCLISFCIVRCCFVCFV